MKHNSKRERTGKARGAQFRCLDRIQPDAAGIDCGQNSHFVAVPSDRDPQPVREFRTFTAELYRLADWLAQCGVKTVAMESTGVDRIPALRDFRAARLRSAAGQRPVMSQRARAQERCQRLRTAA